MKYLLLFASVICLWSCGKNLEELPFQKLNTPYQVTYRDFNVLENGHWILCGGDGEFGVILKSTDGGSTWMNSGGDFKNSINKVCFLNNDTGFAADADILIFKTINGGSSWEQYYANSWPLSVNRNLRDICFVNDSTGFICGGKNYGNGVIYATRNGGTSWSFSEYAHELRGVLFKQNNKGVICGYGALMVSYDGGHTFHNLDAKDDYFTGMVTGYNDDIWMCSFMGNIYSSSDDGTTWIKRKDGNSWNVKNIQFNCIAISPAGKIICSGPNGVISWSDDYGSSWHEKMSFGGTDILKIKWISEQELIAVGKNGGVYKLKI